MPRIVPAYRLRSCVPVPATADDAVALANAGALAETLDITVRTFGGEKFDRIIDCELGAKPAMEDVAIPVPAQEAWETREPEGAAGAARRRHSVLISGTAAPVHPVQQHTEIQEWKRQEAQSRIPTRTSPPN